VTGLLSMRDIVRCWSGTTVSARGRVADDKLHPAGHNVAGASR
jgi:hypothetical protein